MSEDAAIRRANLRKLRLDPAALVQRAGKTYSYWRDLLTSDSKSFGEKAARSIEEQLELPKGWLDRVDADSVASSPAPPPALPEALPVVLDALRAARAQDEVWAVLALLRASDSPLYRARLVELLQAKEDREASATPTADQLLAQAASVETRNLVKPPQKA
jgi:hypothetical protein